MIDETQQVQASLFVLGLLPEEERLAFEAALARNVELREEVASLNNATLALARSVPNLAMPASGRERLLTAIGATSGAAPLPVPGYFIVRNDEEGWQNTPIPGFRIKTLLASQQGGHAIFMVEFAPGTRYPSHAHEHSEQLFVFSGTLQTEGRVLRPGDFLHGEAGTHHQELYSHDGCRAVLVHRAA